MGSLGQFQDPWPLWGRWGVALASSVLLFASVVAHELSHSLVAIRKGIPVKGITLFMFGGVAQISREATRPGTEFLMAVVGPLSSILIGLLFLGLNYAVHPFSDHLSVMTEWLFLANVSLGVFNMLPGFPLDGGRVFRAAVWAVTGSYSKATRVATIGGQAVAVAFVIMGGIFILGEELLQGVWLAIIGWFLWQAASASFRQFRQRQILEGHVSRDIMSTDCPKVSPETSLRELVDGRASKRDRVYLVVTPEGGVQGMVDLQAVRRVRRRDWNTTLVRQVMTPLEKMKTVGPQESAHRVMEIMDEEDTSLVPAVEGEVVLGVVLLDRLFQLAAARSRPDG
ncbi:MAG: Peptidase [Dehalococcoidia bacterium]|nr:Peptidase [Dehalococcoidia bacterium]